MPERFDLETFRRKHFDYRGILRVCRDRNPNQCWIAYGRIQPSRLTAAGSIRLASNRTAMSASSSAAHVTGASGASMFTGCRSPSIRVNCYQVCRSITSAESEIAGIPSILSRSRPVSTHWRSHQIQGASVRATARRSVARAVMSGAKPTPGSIRKLASGIAGLAMHTGLAPAGGGDA